MPESSSQEDRLPAAPNADGLAQLRRLLLTPEQTQIAALQRRLDEPSLHAADVSRVLPEAVTLRSQRDAKLVAALQPTVEEALRVSVKRQPSVLAEALFPLMGPAIRKAIAVALGAMLQSLNQALEHSLSLQGLKWRLQALRTGRPFSEIVLLNTLVYRVEQVFLIHRETGLPLQHRIAPGVTPPDSGMVSGMLTAIQDFVRDSFSAGGGDGLQALQVGEVNVWIEQGPEALLAAVIRGQPRTELRAVLQEALERIHLALGEAFQSFQGDASPFAACGDELDACLQAQYASPGAGRRPAAPVLALAAVALLGLGVWAGLGIRDQRRWNSYVQRLRDEPGLVVTDVGSRNGKYYVAGLRDPLATDPRALLEASKLDMDAVIGRWDAYQALLPAFVLSRARSILDPPPSVALALDGDMLVLTGSAPRSWIIETRRLARVIPGISRLRDDALVDSELASVLQAIEASVVLFPRGAARPAASQLETLGRLARDVRRLDDQAGALGRRVRLEIRGHTDQDAAPDVNLGLSQRRAAHVAEVLGVTARTTIEARVVGVGAAEPLHPERTEADKALNRRVSFRVSIAASPATSPVSR